MSRENYFFLEDFLNRFSSFFHTPVSIFSTTNDDGKPQIICGGEF